jgi:hypothetical protein
MTTDATQIRPEPAVAQAMKVTDLWVSPCGIWRGRRCWRTVAPFIVDFQLPDGTWTRITVPAGFIFDGASVPRVPGVWEAFGDYALEGACIHDWLYRNDSIPLVTKDFADWAFWALMVATDDPPEQWQRSAMWMAVHDFGHLSYHRLSIHDDIRKS